MTPADLLGCIESLNLACTKRDLGGRFRVRTLVRKIRLDGNLANCSGVHTAESNRWRQLAGHSA
jgi:hypothetical protein